MSWIKRKAKRALAPNNPSYIPSETFARVLFDVVTKAGTKDSKIITEFNSMRLEIEKLERGDQETANKLISNLISLGDVYAGAQIKHLKKTLQSHLEEEMIERIEALKCIGAKGPNPPPLAGFAEKLEKLVHEGHAQELAFVLKSADPYLEQVRKGLIAIGSQQLGGALNSLLAGVEEYATSADKAIALGRKNVESWFDNSMERLSGSYKRWAQKWAFVLGFALALLLNVDSLNIAQVLWRNPATRQESTAYIQKYMEQRSRQETLLNEEDLKTVNAEIQKFNFPVGWKLQSYSGSQTVKLFAGSGQIAGICPDLNPGAGVYHPFCYIILDPPQDAKAVMLKLLGCLVTGLATLQGAPFWFDTLKKVVNVRSTGINPVEKPKAKEAAASA
jgi:hypothetical protein